MPHPPSRSRLFASSRTTASHHLLAPHPLLLQICHLHFIFHAHTHARTHASAHVLTPHPPTHTLTHSLTQDTAVARHPDDAHERRTDSVQRVWASVPKVQLHLQQVSLRSPQDGAPVAHGPTVSRGDGPTRDCGGSYAWSAQGQEHKHPPGNGQLSEFNPRGCIVNPSGQRTPDGARIRGRSDGVSRIVVGLGAV